MSLTSRGVRHLNLEYLFTPTNDRMWNDLPFAIFVSGRLNGSYGAVNLDCFPELVFPVLVAQLIVGLLPQLCQLAYQLVSHFSQLLNY